MGAKPYNDVLIITLAILVFSSIILWVSLALIGVPTTFDGWMTLVWASLLGGMLTLAGVLFVVLVFLIGVVK